MPAPASTIQAGLSHAGGGIVMSAAASVMRQFVYIYLFVNFGDAIGGMSN